MEEETYTLNFNYLPLLISHYAAHTPEIHTPRIHTHRIHTQDTHTQRITHTNTNTHQHVTDNQAKVERGMEDTRC